MKQKLLLFSVVLLALCSVTIAQVAYELPAGGWSYVYEGDQLMAIPGDDVNPDQILDGSWVEHSGKWDFLELGAPLSYPGGLVIGTDIDGADFLRIQDPGRPSHFAEWDDYNRKLHFARDLTKDGLAADALLLDDGVTLAFRLKVPLEDGVTPIDQIWPANEFWAVDGVEETWPYPLEGDGYYATEGLGMVGIHHGDGVAAPHTCVGFSLMLAGDDYNTDTVKIIGEGLYMNLGIGSTINSNPSLRELTDYTDPVINFVPCEPTDFNEFWVQIKKADIAETNGTHAVKIWINGDVAAPYEFVVTASDKDHEDNPYMHVGFMNTPENGAMDLDYYAYKPGLIDPVASASGTFDMSFDTQLKSFPNPTTGDVTFSFNLKRDGYTTLEVYNLIGQPVAKVLSKDLPAGAHNISLNVDLTPGQYVYRLQSGDQNEIRKMTILK